MVGVESNTLTYLVEAISPEYDPALDTSSLKPEREALLRIYFYTGCSFYVLPTAVKEYQKIKKAVGKELHDRLCSFLLLDAPSLDQTLLNNRARELSVHHNGADDCALIAEAELSGLQTLLTCDKDMLSHLRPLTAVGLMKPSEFYLTLAIPTGAQPRISPTESNPLYNVSWWRI